MPQAAHNLAAAPTDVPTGRLLSLDVFRGLIMLVMASEGFGIRQLAARHPGRPFWEAIGRQVDHVRWQGCTLWDLIMPGFVIIIGMVLPISFASRRRRGHSGAQLIGHGLGRGLALVLIGILIASDGAPCTEFSFFQVLCQLGLAFMLVLPVIERPVWMQVGAIALILVADWLWFYGWPVPGPDYDFAAVGVPATWNHPQGLAAHWDLNTNPAAAVDRWLLNLFPRATPFRFRAGGGTTLNFIPTAASMLLGVLAGRIVCQRSESRQNLRRLLRLAGICLAGGVLLDPGIVPGIAPWRWTICPIIKRLWTPSFVLYSGGWVTGAIAMVYWLIEIKGLKRGTFLFEVVGVNSLAMYLMASLAAGWVRRTLGTHLGGCLNNCSAGPVLESIGVLALFWLVCWWLYRRRLFLRL